MLQALKNAWDLLRAWHQYKQEIESNIERLRKDTNQAWCRMQRSEEIIRQRTNIDVDLGFGDCTVIVTGQYNGVSYAQVFNVEQPEFNSIVGRLNEMRRHGHVRHVDHPMNMEWAVPLLKGRPKGPNY